MKTISPEWVYAEAGEYEEWFIQAGFFYYRATISNNCEDENSWPVLLLKHETPELHGSDQCTV